jgi:hypothetical protein
MIHLPAPADKRTRIGLSWPLSRILRAKRSRASSANSVRGWSGSGMTWSRSNRPTFRSGLRPTSRCCGTGLSTALASCRRTPSDSSSWSPMAANRRRVSMPVLRYLPFVRLLGHSFEDFPAQRPRGLGRLAARAEMAHRLTASEGHLEGRCLRDDRLQHKSPYSDRKRFS